MGKNEREHRVKNMDQIPRYQSARFAAGWKWLLASWDIGH
jgi:hypothetical protein